MNIYQSEFSHISKQDNTLIQIWTDKTLGVEEYKSELNHFMNLFPQLKPQSLVMDIKKCQLIIPEEIDGWMAEQVLIPIHKKGIRKLAFTIAEDCGVHQSIAASLDKAKPIIQSSYYSGINEATLKTEIDKTASKFDIQSNQESETFNINLKITTNALPSFLTAMQQIEKDQQFVHDHSANYYSLTLREIEIFKLIAYGKTNKQIANDLFIEECSVKSHRKNIKKKLRITSNLDIYNYARCFHIM